MLSISHAVTGAFIAYTIPNIWIFAPLAFISHFFLDHVRHFDVGTGIKKKSRRLAWTLYWTIIDLLLAALLIILIWQQKLTNYHWQLWIGAFFGILPDLLESTDLFFHRTFKILTPLYHLHEKIHRSTANVFWGLLPQFILVIVISLLVIFN